jgi:hypothetical protein
MERLDAHGRGHAHHRVTLRLSRRKVWMIGGPGGDHHRRLRYQLEFQVLRRCRPARPGSEGPRRFPDAPWCKTCFPESGTPSSLQHGVRTTHEAQNTNWGDTDKKAQTNTQRTKDKLWNQLATIRIVPPHTYIYIYLYYVAPPHKYVHIHIICIYIIHTCSLYIYIYIYTYIYIFF